MSFLSSWFQLGAIPANVIKGHYDLMLVALSYGAAVLASYVALNLAGRLRAEKNKKAMIYWLSGGAFTMGASILSMHFIGMLAFIWMGRARCVNCENCQPFLQYHSTR